MQTVLIDVSEELNRIVSVAHLVPSENLRVLEKVMLQLRDSGDEVSEEGAKVSLDMILATSELKSAADAYAQFIINLVDRSRDKPSG